MATGEKKAKASNLDPLGHDSCAPQVFLMALVLTGMSGCDSAGSNNQRAAGTPPNTYTVNVKVSAGGFSTTVPLSLTVTK